NDGLGRALERLRDALDDRLVAVPEVALVVVLEWAPDRHDRDAVADLGLRLLGQIEEPAERPRIEREQPMGLVAGATPHQAASCSSARASRASLRFASRRRTAAAFLSGTPKRSQSVGTSSSSLCSASALVSRSIALPTC